MGKKFRKALLQFIDDIPTSKLEDGFPSSTRTIWNDDNYRLDMQGLTTDSPRCWNLQVQVNKQALFTSAKRAGKNGASVAKVLVPSTLRTQPLASEICLSSVRLSSVRSRTSSRRPSWM
jgi:hypothetical protein